MSRAPARTGIAAHGAVKILSLVLLGGLTTGAAAERLVETREVARGSYLAVQFSPDGQELLVTGPQYRGLQTIPVVGGPARLLSDEPEAGVEARWNRDGTVSFRVERGGTRRNLVTSKTGQARSAAAPKRPVAFTQNERFYVERNGALQEVGSGDRFFGAVISPDGDRVVVQGLATGLYIYTRSTGALVRVGPGTAPAWSPDSKRLVFEVTEDDGHDIVASELYHYDLATDRVVPLTTTDRVIERRPSFAPDGKQLVFDDNTGGLFVGKVAP